MNTTKTGYSRFLLLVAGLGGLLYGVDVGIISGALPYLQATFTLPDGSLLKPGQLSFIVAAVLLGSVISTLFAGALADFFGRKKMMAASGILFVISIPVIALAHGYWLLVFGRLLQGISAGLIGVVIPLYLAECLDASNRGKGTGIFQWLLTFGIFAATIIGLYFSHCVDEVAKSGDAAKLFEFKDTAWRGIFWVSFPPGMLFVIGSLMVAESPRWLFRRGRKDAAKAALLRSRTDEQAEIELREMEEAAASEMAKTSAGDKIRESLLRRKYVVPFLLACVILACNQLTGINSIIGYNSTILIQAGLSDLHAHFANTLFTLINFLVTIGAVLLVDRKGRKFLLTFGTAGIIASLFFTGLLFHDTERHRADFKDRVQAMVSTNETLTLKFDRPMLNALTDDDAPHTLVIIYSYGGFHGATTAIRSDDETAKPVQITRENCIPPNKIAAFFEDPDFNAMDLHWILYQWLIHHILNSDRDYAECVRAWLSTRETP